jgi:hypothetical protein
MVIEAEEALRPQPQVTRPKSVVGIGALTAALTGFSLCFFARQQQGFSVFAFSGGQQPHEGTGLAVAAQAQPTAGKPAQTMSGTIAHANTT